MRWPWSKPARDHATLTILGDTDFIIGWPRYSTEEECSEVADALRMWAASDNDRRLLMFPWPVDVIDQRPKYEPLDIKLQSGWWEARGSLAIIAKSLHSIDRKMVRRRPRIIECKHPELHPEVES